MTTPSDPFSGDPADPTPPGYGAPPPGYGAPPPGYGTPAADPFSTPGGPVLADWPLRAQGALVDWLGPSLLATFVQYTISYSLGVLLSLVAFGWTLYNAYLAGQTGQSYGRKWAGTRLLREQDGQVIGGGLGIGRAFVHILDAIPCYLGFLWPLWDAKRQTFADKILKTVVVKA